MGQMNRMRITRRTVPSQLPRRAIGSMDESMIVHSATIIVPFNGVDYRRIWMDRKTRVNNNSGNIR